MEQNCHTTFMCENNDELVKKIRNHLLTVKKDDWQTIDMPQQVEYFTLEKKLEDNYIELLKYGYFEDSMDSKWFMYCEDDKMYIHRSWTGYCLYIVELSNTGILQVTVNRNNKQYAEKNINFDKFYVDHLISMFIARNIKKQ